MTDILRPSPLAYQLALAICEANQDSNLHVSDLAKTIDVHLRPILVALYEVASLPNNDEHWQTTFDILFPITTLVKGF